MDDQLREPAAPSRAAASSDEAWWQRLVDRYSSLLWAVTRAHHLSHNDAADVVQTSWLRLFEHRANIRNPDGIGAWLATTARRECLRSLRHATRCHPSDTLDVLIDEEVPGADARLLRAERDAALRNAFERLPRRDQTLLGMLTADPRPSYEEIAAALGMAIGAIGPERGRALKRLRREFVAIGGVAAQA